MSKFRKSEKYILFLPGGTMAGVFGAGVLTEFEKYNLYDRFEAIYAISAGAVNASYFMSNKMGEASKLYWTELTKGFVKKRRTPFVLFHRFILELLPWHIHKKIFNIMDVDFLREMVEKKMPFDFTVIRKNSPEIYLKLIDTDSGKILYHDLKKAKEPLKIIEAAVTCLPFSCCPVKIDGRKYADGGIAEPIGIKTIIKRHPKKRIIVIANLNSNRSSKLIKNVNKLTAAATRISVGKNVSKYFATKEDALINELEELKKMKNIILIERPMNLELKAYTKDVKELKRAYAVGRKIGREFVKKIENNML
jgi:predicted patatin/cPLA2 family phospholipase